MAQLIEFIGNHVTLFLALAVISALLAQNLMSGAGKSQIDNHRVTELINRDDAVVVDVRPMADFTEGHIVNALNIPLNGFKNQLGQLEKHRDKPIILTCRSGATSGSAYKLLIKEGFKQVHELHGGMLAWQSANLPISRKK
ncbi:rhodanese-like domain-containing protein [Pseudomonadota bacterium]